MDRVGDTERQYCPTCAKNVNDQVEANIGFIRSNQKRPCSQHQLYQKRPSSPIEALARGANARLEIYPKNIVTTGSQARDTLKQPPPSPLPPASVVRH